MSAEPTEPRRRALFAIVIALVLLGAGAAAYYGLGHEDPRQNAVDDATAREALHAD